MPVSVIIYTKRVITASLEELIYLLEEHIKN